jgi:hypothetical protein
MRLGRQGWRWGIPLLAVVIRLAVIVVLQSHLTPRSTYEHGEIAANLVRGRGFAIAFLGGEGPTSQQAPVYPILLAGFYAVFGIERPAALLALQVFQALCGGLMALGVMRLSGRLFPDRAWISRSAGLIAAMHPTLVYCATHIQVACLAATLTVWILVLAEELASGWGVGRAAGLGWWIGILVLLDPILGLILPVTGLVLVRSAGWRRGAARWGLVAGCGVLVVLPWIMRNAWVHREFVPVKSTFGYAFWQGNCALSEGTDKVIRPGVAHILSAAVGDARSWNEALWAARHEAGYIDDIALSPAEKAALGQLREPERSRVLFRRAILELKRDPGRYARLCWKRLRYFFIFDETNPKARDPRYRIGHMGLSICALIGLFLCGREGFPRLLPGLAFAVLVAGFHALTIVSARFHIPLEPILAVWAGAGFTRAAGIAARFWRSSPAADDIVGVGVEGRLGEEAVATG